MTKTSSFPLRLALLVIGLIALAACERDTYSTWSCNSATELKIPMVLRKARMEFKSGKWDYCGSLGNQSYFDVQCPAAIQGSRLVFTPASGVLVNQDQQYQCTVL